MRSWYEQLFPSVATYAICMFDITKFISQYQYKKYYFYVQKHVKKNKYIQTLIFNGESVHFYFSQLYSACLA